MALELRLRRAGNGRPVVDVNGKPFEVVSAYKHHLVDGWFFLILSGKQALQWDDIDEHWKVIGKDGQYMAFAQRAMSYHLAEGEQAEIPMGCQWPKLQTPHRAVAVVGPTDQSVRAFAQLYRDRYYPGLELEDITMGKAADECGNGPDAWLLKITQPKAQ